MLCLSCHLCENLTKECLKKYMSEEVEKSLQRNSKNDVKIKLKLSSTNLSFNAFNCFKIDLRTLMMVNTSHN